MTLQEIYDLGIEMAIKADPRGEEKVRKQLQKAKKEYDELSKEKKEEYDNENLTNPYSDSRLYVGDPKKEVKTIIAGIDAEVGEVLLADRLNEKGEKIDAIVSHHAHGMGLSGLHEVMGMLIDQISGLGVPENIVDAIMQERIHTLEHRFVTIPNHNQTIDAARLLKMPLMSLHTAWDNLTWRYITDFIANKEYETVGDLFDVLCKIPEFKKAKKYKAPPLIVSGKKTSRPGKVIVEMTGGTNPANDIYAELAKAGVGTVIQMHIPEDALKEMGKYHINAIDTGHIPSDSIGANLFLDELEKRGVNVIEFGGLVRVSRAGTSQ